MIDEPLLTPPDPSPVPTKIRITDAHIRIIVPAVTADGVVVGETMIDVSLTDPKLTTAQRDFLVNIVRQIAQARQVI